LRIAQRPQAPADRDGGIEAVAAQDVEVAVVERGQAGDVLVADLVALSTERGDGGVDVPGRPEHRRLIRH
jgi:hypothetical protein